MSEVSAALREVRRRIRDIEIERAVADTIGSLDRRLFTKEETITFINMILGIYREGIFERMDSVEEDWK